MAINSNNKVLNVDFSFFKSSMILFWVEMRSSIAVKN